jgi:hypothetical protein
VDYDASQRSANCWYSAEAGIRTDGIKVAKVVLGYYSAFEHLFI